VAFVIISRSGAQFVNGEELFNLRHSQARNIVEQIFGVMKRRWGLFSCAPEYPIDTQAMMIPAIGALHNFVRIHDASDDAVDLSTESDAPGPIQREDSMQDFIEMQPREISPEELGMEISAEERVRATNRRDAIAQKMWEDYVAVLAERGMVPST
jgi:hypothetical protein